MRDEYRWLGERSRGRDNREREEKRGNQPESVTMINDMYLVERQWPNYKKKHKRFLFSQYQYLLGVILCEKSRVNFRVLRKTPPICPMLTYFLFSDLPVV